MPNFEQLLTLLSPLPSVNLTLLGLNLKQHFYFHSVLRRLSLTAADAVAVVVAVVVEDGREKKVVWADF